MRVIIEQPSLAQYRVPVFRELARRPGLDFRLHYSKAPTLANVLPEGFDAVFVPSWRRTIAGRRIIWNTSCWRNAARAQADVLVMNWNLNHLNLVPALLRARANGIATILWGHGYSKAEAGWRRVGRHRAAGLATALLFYNHTVAREFLEQGWPAEKLHVALNAIDQEPIQEMRRRFLDDPARLAAFRREQGLGSGPIILYVSRIKPENRVDLMLRAAALLRERHPGLRSVIVGGGEVDPLKRLARDLRIEKAVRFAGPLYEEASLAPLFLSATAFCYPANIGLSILHAFGYGLPVITTDRNDVQNPEIEALEPGRNGLTYRHDSAQSLAESIERLIAEPGLRSSLSAEAHGTAVNRFSLKGMVDGMERAIRYAGGQRARMAQMAADFSK